MRIRLLPPSAFMYDVPELRQEPALLRVLRNSPRAMPLSGYELVRPELTCKESALLCFHRLLTFENAKVEADQLHVKT